MAYPGYQPPSKTGQLKAAASRARTSKADISRDLDIARGRKEFFSNRPDVSDDRALRRMKQADETQRFKNLYTKPVAGSSNLLQMTADAPRSLAQERIRLANMYGPTFKEIGSDIGYAVGSMGKGLGQFIGKGGVIGNVLSGLYDKFKGGTQEGIETVKGLYDNLRTTLSGQPTVTYGGGSTMVTTSDGQPRVDLTPTSIATETLPSMNLSRNVGDESDPSIFGITNTGVPLPFLRSTGTVDLPYNNISSFNPDTYQPGYLPEGFSNVGIENPLFRNVSYEPIRVSDMDITGLTAQNFELPSLQESYNFIRNPQLNTPYGNLRLDNVLSGRPKLGYANTIMINGVPVDLSATIGNQGLNIGGSFSFKDGGSVDKYAGLGYKLK